MLEQSITYKFLKALEHLEFGSADVTTPDGKVHHFKGPQESVHATLYLRDWRAIPAFAYKGDAGFADAYQKGWWESDDITDLFLIGLQNQKALEPYLYGSLLGRMVSRISYLFTRNTLEGSKRNIHAHYDLGNAFYRLWLDESMTYSSALFDDPQQSLLSAQHNKYDRILNRLGDSGRVLEIGCGWGGFAERALERKDFAIKGLTISEAQHDYAQKRLGNKAQIALEDYRLQDGKYDHIVSIEMFEAVGENYWPVYFQTLKSLLANKGKAMIQTITIGNEYFERYRKCGDMIRTYIFPGGMLPSPARFEQEARKVGLHISDTHTFGLDYARTMERWLQRFEAQLNEVKSLGFDDKFIRIWRFYLACCIASFKIGQTNVMQVELVHA